MKLAPAILLVVAVAGARPTRIDAQAVTSGPAAPYVYSVPEATGDGWDVANVDEVGVDATVLAQLVTEIREQRLSNLHSVLAAAVPEARNRTAEVDEQEVRVRHRRGYAQVFERRGGELPDPRVLLPLPAHVRRVFERRDGGGRG